MIWGSGDRRRLSKKPRGTTPTSPIMLLTCTQAIPTPTAPMIFRWSRMNSSSLLMQPPWKKSKASSVASLDVGARLRPRCKQVLLMCALQNTRGAHDPHARRPARAGVTLRLMWTQALRGEVSPPPCRCWKGGPVGRRARWRSCSSCRVPVCRLLRSG